MASGCWGSSCTDNVITIENQLKSRTEFISHLFYIWRKANLCEEGSSLSELAENIL